MNSEFIIAVHSLVFLANRSDGTASSEEIAANVCTHPARIRKVLGCLRKEGYVATREGSGGGYKLVKEPDDVTLADVYRSMAVGSLAPSWCSGSPDMDCMVGANMQDVMNSVFCGAEKQLEGYFSNITIGSMLASIKERQHV